MATIFCFSSTGNSLYVAKKIADKINAEVLSMSKPVENCSDDVIGFIFPVYFWGLPKIVTKFVSDLQIQNKHAYIFAVITYGGEAFGVTGTLNKLLLTKGVSLQYRRKIKCVENYTPSYKINDKPEVHQKTDELIKIVANEISKNQRSNPGTHTVLNTLVYKLFPAHKADCDKNFNVLPSCTSCGACERICPVNNISMENGKPTFLHNCEHCIACVHACPVSAIQWKSGNKDKGRYRNPNIGSKELAEFCGTASSADNHS